MLQMRAKHKASKRGRLSTGQVALEYALGILIVAGLCSGLYLFYQGFVQGNLFGSAGKDANKMYLLAEDNKQMGLHKAASLPTP